MKNVFQSAILVSLFLLSCSDEADRTENVTGTVGFHTADVTPSRAGIVGLPDLKLKGAGFRVNAYATGTEEWSVAKDNLNTKPGLMWNQPVTWDVPSGAWTYTPAKYWPGKVDGTQYGKVSFFAWNDVGTAVEVPPNTTPGAPQLTYTVPNAQSDQKDLVTAMATDKTVTGGDVSLTFGHVLSRIGFTAKLDDHYEDVTVTITSLKVKYANNAVESKGVYTFGKTDPWSFPEEEDKVYMLHTGDDDVVVDAPGVPLNNDATPTETDLTTAVAANYLMLLPQEVSDGDVMIEVTWTFDDGGGGGALTQTQPIPLPTQIWLPGKCYNYSLKVSLTGITLDPVLVNPWGDDDLYKPCTITYKTPDGTDIVEYRTTNVSYPVGGQYFGRDLYRIGAWTTEPDGTGDSYPTPGTITYPGPGDLTLYARWDPVLDGMSNCYMVAPTGTKEFSVSRAFTYEKETFTNTLRTGGEYTDEFAAEVVWEDVAGLITAATVDASPGNQAKVTVTTSNNSGNAVVKIYKKDDSVDKTPVWSYHIWVTDYVPEVGVNTWTNPNNASFTFMDRNLGAMEAALSLAGRGLFYQWGRKDPFPGGKTGTAGFVALSKFYGINQTGAGSKTITYAPGLTVAEGITASIQHPTTFYSGLSSYDHDWLSVREHTLWNHGNKLKAIYDPCPEGWRVPAMINNQSPWTGMNSTSSEKKWGNWDVALSGDMSGMDFNGKDSGITTALYPASGRRSAANGILESDNALIHIYSGTNQNERLVYSCLGYDDGSVSLGNTIRAHGCSVRCVLEHP